MAGDQLLSGKTIIVAGADCAFGREVTRAVSGQGATVLVLDEDDAALLALSRNAPRLIEHLAMPMDSASGIDTLGRIWDAEPIDCLVLLQSLRMARRPGTAVKSMLLLARALQPGLAAARGCVVTVIRASAPGSDPVRLSAEAAQMRMSSVLPDQFAPLGVRVNTMRLTASADTSPGQGAIDALIHLAGDREDGLHGSILAFAEPASTSGPVVDDPNASA